MVIGARRACLGVWAAVAHERTPSPSGPTRLPLCLPRGPEFRLCGFSSYGHETATVRQPSPRAFRWCRARPGSAARDLAVARTNSDYRVGPPRLGRPGHGRPPIKSDGRSLRPPRAGGIPFESPQSKLSSGTAHVRVGLGLVELKKTLGGPTRVPVSAPRGPEFRPCGFLAHGFGAYTVRKPLTSPFEWCRPHVRGVRP